jgi:hypothetical protein
MNTPPRSGLAKGSGRIGYLLTAHNHNPAIECIRDCYFPIRNVAVTAAPPILATDRPLPSCWFRLQLGVTYGYDFMFSLLMCCYPIRLFLMA